MSKSAVEIIKEIDMKAACFMDMLKSPQDPKNVTIFMNEDDYEIMSQYAVSWMFTQNVVKGCFDSYKGMGITIAPYIKDIQIGLKMYIPEENKRLQMQQEEK